MEVFSVHGAPSEYILQENILNILEAKLLERGFNSALVVHGEKSWNEALPYWPKFSKVTIKEYTYSGECSLSQIEKVASKVMQEGYDCIIGVGGGKVLDLVKSACQVTHKQSILIPTLASNCSPWTPVSVIYDDTGTFIRFDVYPTNSTLVLIEPRILLHAPLDMLIAGIGDTLAKWYEADTQISCIENKTIPIQLSHFSAKQCKDVLLQHSEAAIQAVKSATINDSFIQVVETIIMLGGMVGGYGDHYGRVAGAHSIHNGLTILEETHTALHGEKVAYGILVQLILENKEEELLQLVPFYREVGLPESLTQIGISNITEEMISNVAKKATEKGESIHVMPIGEITPSRVIKAIKHVESLFSK